MSFPETSPEMLLQYIMDSCAKLGATDVDLRYSRSTSESVSVRENKLEKVERNESAGVALRCFYDRRQASVSGTDLSKDGINQLVERCASMAKLAPEDPYAGVAEAGALAQNMSPLDLSGDDDYTFELLKSDALEAEAAALSVPGVKQVSGSGSGWTKSERWLAASNGFAAHKASGMSSLGLTALAERDGAMERDYANRSSRRRADRLSPEHLGKLAADRTLQRLGATKPKSQTAPVIYDMRVSTSLLNAFINAISGPAIARGVSFLKDHLGKQVFSDHINIIDDPFRERGHGTRNHDGEGLPVSRQHLIADGKLEKWLLNGPSAKQLGLTSNGFSGVAFGNAPGISTSNVHIEPGKHSLSELMQQSGTGLIVSDMFGPSINSNSGDYSVGVSGMWYENGELAYPVSEVTIAGNLIDMFANLIPANDLEFLGARNAPSLLIESMTLAGA